MLNIDKVDLSYISCACNRTPHSADWGYNGLVCYGACHSVAVFDPSVSIMTTFNNDYNMYRLVCNVILLILKHET